MTRHEYPIILEPLPQDEGGGWLARAPDLPGCISEGPTPEASVASVMDAIAAWIDEATEQGVPIPPPSRHIQAAE